MVSVEFRVQGDFALDFCDFKDCLEGEDGKDSVGSVVIVLYDLSVMERMYGKVFVCLDQRAWLRNSV